ncbi:hypothetical protein PHYC_00996 [Phycisphaerales bacterium]|nr:hypothetical protein PHYC_00996 [Phycisphaerales bacterium]
MLRVFGFGIFLSAALLFLVQPMSGKVLLPLLGGSPSVWNTCMVFFQAVLLGGYLYSHVVSTRLAVRAQVWVHGLVLVGAAAYVAYLNLWPGSILARLLSARMEASPHGAPAMWLMATLALLVGPQFLVVSATGPLLQRWFSRTRHGRAGDPYFLYAASNAGSLIGLLAYPLVFEPLLTRWQQHGAWAGGLVLFVPLALWSGVTTAREAGVAASAPAPQAGAGPVTMGRRLGWIALAMIPSSLMLGVTQHISTDVAAIPLLWVIPLGLYLVSFVWAFSPRLALSSRAWGRIVPVGVAGVAAMLLAGIHHPVLVLAGLHLATFLSVAMLCHTRLAESRPGAEHLTEFYLLLSLGGVLGGAFNALVAPVVFSSIMEYPMMMGAACIASPQVRDVWCVLSGARAKSVALISAVAIAAVVVVAAILLDAGERAGSLRAMAAGDSQRASLLRFALVGVIPTAGAFACMVRRGGLRFAAAIAGLLLVSPFVSVGTGVLYCERTFFGVHYVMTDPDNTRRTLRHGTTLHGLQIRTDFVLGASQPYPDAAFRERLLFDGDSMTARERLPWLHLIPGTYFHPSGPLGDVMRETTRSGRMGRIGLIGLGAGSILAYARPGSEISVFEIDPAVLRIAQRREYFSFAHDALRDETVRIHFPALPGDGRVEIGKTPDGTYDLVIIDAFTSDAIPVHLITKEAVDTYRKTLKANGLIAFHVSSRYFDLSPVVSRIGKELGLVVRSRLDGEVSDQQHGEAKQASNWVVLARDERSLGALAADPAWRSVAPGARTWTDDYSNLLGAFQGWGLPVR